MSEIITVGNYVNYPPLEETCRQDNDETIMFLGKMDYDPNVTAVSYFVKSIFPHVKERHKNLSFLIVGARPTQEIKKFGLIDGIQVTGFVDSTVPYFMKSSIVIAPMLTGAGIQNKIIQAMSHGCCVATTTIGSEGLTLYGNEIKIFNNDSEWIDGIDSLLKNKKERITLGNNARETIRRTLTKDAVYSQFEELMKIINK